MRLFEVLKTETFIIMIFYIFLQLCKHKNIVLLRNGVGNTSQVLAFSILSIISIFVVKLSGFTDNFFVAGLFAIASGYYSGVFFGFVTALFSGFIMAFFGVVPGMQTFFSLVAAGISCGMMSKKINNKFSGMSRAVICCILSSMLKFVLSIAFFRVELISALYLYILDMTGAWFIILIADGYIGEINTEDENKRISSELLFLKEQNTRLARLNKTKDKIYASKYNTKTVLSTLDAILDLCRKDTFKASELILVFKDYACNLYKYGGYLLKLSKGIEIISSYIEVMRVIYCEKIKVNLLIKGDISGCYMPIMIAEPIIENSIIHGLAPKSTGGMVFVNVEVLNDRISFIIEDTGIGIDSERIVHLCESGSKSLGRIYRRLRSIYKNSFYFEIDSKIEEGTRITVQIPKKAGDVL